jgi:hypothetical protein
VFAPYSDNLTKEIKNMFSKVVVVSFMVTHCFFAVWADPSHDTSSEKSKGTVRVVEAKKDGEQETWTARMGETHSSSLYRQLFIYSKQKLSNVEFLIGDSENWEKMKVFKSPNQFTYGTEMFLPSAPGQKFTVRGTNSEGKRITALVTVESSDGLKLSVKPIKEESIENTPVSTENRTSRVLQLAQANIGRTVGSGDCSALKGGARLGSLGGGGAGIDKLAPGMVLRLSPGSSFSGSMGRFNVSSSGHYIVLEAIRPDGTFTFLDQNWMGGSSAGRRVRRATGNFRTLKGSATIYSGD